jgi:hypothetical protein
MDLPVSPVTWFRLMAIISFLTLIQLEPKHCCRRGKYQNAALGGAPPSYCISGGCQIMSRLCKWWSRDYIERNSRQQYEVRYHPAKVSKKMKAVIRTDDLKHDVFIAKSSQRWAESRHDRKLRWGYL